MKILVLFTVVTAFTLCSFTVATDKSCNEISTQFWLMTDTEAISNQQLSNASSQFVAVDANNKPFQFDRISLTVAHENKISTFTFKGNNISEEARNHLLSELSPKTLIIFDLFGKKDAYLGCYQFIVK